MARRRGINNWRSIVGIGIIISIIVISLPYMNRICSVSRFNSKKFYFFNENHYGDNILNLKFLYNMEWDDPKNIKNQKN